MLLVISPHLDDAVLGAGDAIATRPGTTVVTVFAGDPPAGRALTPWDAAAGFVAGREAMARRREEDRQALAHLAARPVWLPFLDLQYGESPPAEAVRAELDRQIRAAAPDSVLLPLGLRHGDHRLTHEAVAGLLDRHPELPFVAYEDAIYRRFPDAGLEERLAGLRERGFTPIRLAPGPPASAVKRQSLSCYASQLRAAQTLSSRPLWLDALEPEGLWRLERARPA